MGTIKELPIKLGTRKVMQGSSTLMLNIPVAMMRTAGLSADDTVRISMDMSGAMLVIPVIK